MAKTNRTLPTPAPAPRHQKVEHKRVNISVEARHITTTHNPRWPVPALQMLDYVPIDLCKGWVNNGTEEQKGEFCKLIEQHEPEIVALADSIRAGEEQRGYGQLQAVILRPFRVKVGTEQEDNSEDVRNVYETRYGMIAGERRLLANRYNFAKHGMDLPMMAIVVECTKDEAYEMAIEENAHRRDPNDIEWGAMYLWYHTEKQRVTPEGTPMVGEDNKPVIGWTVNEIAEKFHVKPGHVRGRMACATPGKLKPEQIAAYMQGKIKITRLVEIATGQKPYRNPLEPHHRRGVRTLAECRKRLDDLVEDGKDEDYADVQMLAWLMLYETNDAGQVTKKGIREALADSRKRIDAGGEEAEPKPARRVAAKKKARVAS